MSHKIIYVLEVGVFPIMSRPFQHPAIALFESKEEAVLAAKKIVGTWKEVKENPNTNYWECGEGYVMVAGKYLNKK